MGISLFRNLYVQDILQGQDPHHCTFYQEKLLHLLSLIVFILNKDISLVMSESYLKYKGDFFAETYDFWWDPTYKNSFGTCIDNFMAQ